ncbi:MAG TPA: hypothetical protein VFF52_23475 [Isosphaeraceae bacterium]|nr:hypothetical protein [Isosphaeraceae bacterium]
MPLKTPIQPYDKCSKHMIQHYGNSILRLAGVLDIPAWTPLQAELVHIRRFPDGVLEVPYPGQSSPDIFIIEVATDPDARIPSQAVQDTALVYLEREIVPEVIVLFLRKKRHLKPADSVTLRSRRGLTRWHLFWKAIKLWEVPAEELIALGDVGLLPWVPLAQFAGPPERFVSRCRARIDHQAPPLGHAEHQNLLAVTQLLLGLRSNQKNEPLLERLRALLGGRQAMMESPIYQEIVEESERKGATEGKREMLLNILVGRFGPAAKDLELELKAVEFDRLDDLGLFAAKCRNLAAFRKRLLS